MLCCVMRIELDDLEAFVATVQTGSIVGAAEKIHLSQSALSRRIQSLEETFKTPLLLRDTRPLQPTAAGKQVFDVASQTIGGLHELSERLTGIERISEFRFGVSRTLGDLAMVQTIKSLRANFPKLKVKSVMDWSGYLIDKLEARQLDAAVLLLRSGESLPKGILGEPIGTMNLQIIVAKGIAKQKYFDGPALSAMRWIVNPRGCPIREQLEQYLRQQQLPFDVAIEADSVELKIALAAQGVGATYVLPHMLDMSTFRDDIAVLDTGKFAPNLSCWVGFPSHNGRTSEPTLLLKGTLTSYLALGKSVGAMRRSMKKAATSGGKQRGSQSGARHK